jgi:uncharacterized protein
MPMQFEWDERKRKANLKKHGLDFAQCESVFLGPTYTFPDDRDYEGEERSIAVGILDAALVIVVFIEHDEKTRVISMRRASSQETKKYEKEIFGC